MSVSIFQDDQTIMFVGGRGDGSGATDINGGGCTKTFWNTRVAAVGEAAALAELMEEEGQALISLDGLTYDESVGRITGAGVGFLLAQVGMSVYITDGDVNVSTGRYQITDVDPGYDWIEVLGLNGDDATVDVEVGGAFDILDNALDDSNASFHSVSIYTKLNEVLTGSITLSAGGYSQRNTFKHIIGYNTVPNDMKVNGAYYESPEEILQNGSIDLTKCITFDADGGSFDILNMSNAASNLIFENLHLTNSTGDGLGFVAGTSVNIVLRNCRFSDISQVMHVAVDSVLVNSCFTDDNMTWTPFQFSGGNCNVINNVMMIGGGNITNWDAGGTGAAIGNISIGGTFGYRINTGSSALIANNTIYDTITYGVMMDNCDSVVIYNNIFSLTPGAIGISPRAVQGGSVLYNDYNCFIESDGTPLIAMGNAFVGGEDPVIGMHSIEADPQFMDAAGYDFRLKPTSPCLNTGKKKYENIGAWPRISRIRR